MRVWQASAPMFYWMTNWACLRSYRASRSKAAVRPTHNYITTRALGLSAKLRRVQEAVSLDAPQGVRGRLTRLASHARAATPTLAEACFAALSALLLLFAFPDFGAWPLAWVAFVPLLIIIARRPRAPQSFLTGWLAGTIFFYASCHWLTFPLIRYAAIPTPLAHVLLLPAALAGGAFTALFALALARLCARFGSGALFLAPPVWAACEWARLGVIGQL